MIQYSTKAPFKCFDGFFTNGPQPYVNSFVIIFKTIKRSQNIHFDGDLVKRKYWFDCRYSTIQAMDFKFSEKRRSIYHNWNRIQTSLFYFALFIVFIQTKFPLIHNELCENMTYICMYLTLSSELFWFKISFNIISYPYYTCSDNGSWNIDHICTTDYQIMLRSNQLTQFSL